MTSFRSCSNVAARRHVACRAATCLRYELEHFAPHHFERFLVPAGLTGLWQVSARAHSTFVEALDMDVLYAQSFSLGLDLSSCCRTPLQLFRRQGTA